MSNESNSGKGLLWPSLRVQRVLRVRPVTAEKAWQLRQGVTWHPQSGSTQLRASFLLSSGTPPQGTVQLTVRRRRPTSGNPLEKLPPRRTQRFDSHMILKRWFSTCGVRV